MAGMLRGSGVFCFCKDNRQLTVFPPAADVVYTGCLLGGVHDLDATILGPAIFARLGAGRALFAVADHRDLAAGPPVGLHRGRYRLVAALAAAPVVHAGAPHVLLHLQGIVRGQTGPQVLLWSGYLWLDLARR